MRAVLLAGLAAGSTLLGGAVAHATDAKTFMGFRLLDLEDQSVKWDNPKLGRGAVVTYAFADRRVKTPGARNCAAMVPPRHAHDPSGITATKFREEVAAAFRMWEQVADISFRQSDDADTADILIGAQAEPVGRAFTNVALRTAGGDRKVIGRSLICLNPERPWKVGFDGRLEIYDLRYTMAHEIGHAIGLDHPSPAGQLMSYRYDERHAGLQPGDVKGAVLLYGARPGAARFATAPDAAPATPGKGERGWPFGIGVKQAPRATTAADRK